MPSKAFGKRGRPNPRFRRTALESLEDRSMMSGSPILGLGVVGDSLSDEYEYAGELRAYARNWVELLAQEKGINVGPLQQNPEPRREGYAYDWARVGATSASLLSEQQHTGLADQIRAGLVSHAVMAIGQNDFFFLDSQYADLYYGRWSPTQIATYSDSVVANIQTALATLDGTGVKLIVSNIVDYGVAPTTRSLFPSGEGRDRVASVIAGINTRIAALADQYQVPLVDLYGFAKTLLGTNLDPILSQQVGGQTFRNSGGILPHNEFVLDGCHPHTVPSAIFANLFLEGFALGYGTPVDLFTQAQMVALIGDRYGGDTLSIDYSRFIVLPGTSHARPSTLPGVFDPATATFFLNATASGGDADWTFSYGVAGAGWVPLVGDWDGDGIQTAGVYDGATSTFYLRNTHAGGPADIVFSFGVGGQGWQPLAGDWDGDGIETVGLYVPASGAFFLRNQHQGGAADLSFAFGVGGQGWKPIAGDWDGNGVDTAGLYVPDSSTFFLRNRHQGGAADVAFTYGVGGLGWQPLSGDWDGNGADSVGLYAPITSTFFLRNALDGGAADLVFDFGVGGHGWLPLAGKWSAGAITPAPPAGDLSLASSAAAAWAAEQEWDVPSRRTLRQSRLL